MAFIPITMFIVNPLLALFLVWALRLPDKELVGNAGIQFWVVAGIPVIISAVGLGLFARETDKFAPKSRKRESWGWKIMVMMFPLVWAVSLVGNRARSLRVSELATRLEISYFQAKFLQATALPVLVVFIVGFLSMYAVGLASGERFRPSGAPPDKPRPRPSRRLRAAVIAACYVVMAVVFVLAGRSAGDVYW